MAAPKPIGTCRPMPSLRQISTSRSAQEMNEISAKIVIHCHSPPSRNGAKARP